MHWKAFNGFQVNYRLGYMVTTFSTNYLPAGAANQCLTCSLIQMGSSMAYGDNSCPQCGAKCL